MRLPPGFRFHPTDVELILYYLKRKIMGKKLHYEAIAEVNIYKFSPWDLPDKSSLKSKDLEWFFFCPREKKYATGVRVKRATENGYWKTTGKDRIISCNEKTVGAVKTLIFHLGHAPQGERTDWVIHEYRIRDDKLAEAGVQDSYVLCKVFKKNGLGPKNGAQYGAPFNEDDWADDDDDNDVAQNHALSLAAEDQPQTVSMQPEEQSLPLGSGLFEFGSVNGQLPIHDEGLSSSVIAPASMMAAGETNDEIVQLLNSFADEDMLSPVGNGLKQDDLTDNGNNNVSSNEGLEIYNGLHDLDSWTMINEGGFDFSGVQFGYPSNILPEDNSTYIELDDLRLPLDCSTEVTTGTPFSSLCEAFASYCHENMIQLPSGTRLAGMDQYTKFANELAMLPNTSEGDKSLDALQMMDHHFYQGAIASNNIDSQFAQLENAVFFAPHTMERGSHLVNPYSRFTESIPAHLPSAAKLLALSSYGGSSIHIKAEVTHGAGECTNEALEVMMGGSSSCWCNLLLWKFQPRVLEGLLNLVEFISNLILVCCIKDAISWTCYYCLNENLPYSSEQPKLIISLMIFDCYKLSHIDKMISPLLIYVSTTNTATIY